MHSLYIISESPFTRLCENDLYLLGGTKENKYWRFPTQKRFLEAQKILTMRKLISLLKEKDKNNLSNRFVLNEISKLEEEFSDLSVA